MIAWLNCCLGAYYHHTPVSFIISLGKSASQPEICLQLGEKLTWGHLLICKEQQLVAILFLLSALFWGRNSFVKCRRLVGLIRFITGYSGGDEH